MLIDVTVVVVVVVVIATDGVVVVAAAVAVIISNSFFTVILPNSSFLTLSISVMPPFTASFFKVKNVHPAVLQYTFYGNIFPHFSESASSKQKMPRPILPPITHKGQERYEWKCLPDSYMWTLARTYSVKNMRRCIRNRYMDILLREGSKGKTLWTKRR
uniref:Uncharacterized protein n=1 Tax=Octopus bimaculoides TaxID=37653 RepID=A0A0L8HSF6_OCTBM